MLTVPIQMPDGTRVTVRMFPTARESAPVVVMTPGVGVPARYYDHFAERLAAEGVHAAVTDLRGQGDSAPKPSRASDYGYQELVSVDFPAVLEVVRENFDTSTPYLLGHSLGGQLATMYAARSGHVGGLVLIASGTPFHRAYPGMKSPGLFLGASALSLATSVAGYWPGDRVDIGGFGPQSRVLISDWARLARTGKFEPIGADVDYEKLIAQLSIRVLSITIEGDDTTPKSAAKHLVAKMPEADVTFWHQPKRLGHNTWIADPDGTVQRIVKWIRDA